MFESKIVIMNHSAEILQLTWFGGSYLEGNAEHHRHFHSFPFFLSNWYFFVLKMLQWKKRGVPDKDFSCWGQWERQIPAF